MSKSKVFCIMLILFGLIGVTSFLSAQERQISVSESPNQTRLLNNSDFGFEVEFKVGDLQINEIKTKAGIFDELSIANYGFTSRVGEPKLPVLSKIIAVPVGATVSFDVLNRNQTTLTKTMAQLKNHIIPAQLSISKSADPEQITFEVNQAAYSRDAFTDNAMFAIEEIGFMRGMRVFQIYFEPVRYNPVIGELIVSNDVLIRVNFNNPDLAATEAMLDKTASYEFDRLYQRTIFNWREDQRPSLVRYPTKYLILCPSNYVTTLQPFVDWKKQQGYDVIVTTVGTGGTIANTTSAIITYMQNMWNAATTGNPMPSYLLIVGDTSTSGDNIIANTGATGTHPTDLTYVRLNGTDYLPELYYGRFSVSSASELTNIINKTLTYEKTLMPDLSYLGNVVMIAGADASYAPTYGNGQINYGTTHYFNTTNGITSDTYLYPASASSDAAILANANTGRGYINYTAHGSETGWADPTFTVSNVNAMTNTNKYGVMVGNCCLTNKFDYPSGPCFGEAIIRNASKAGVVYVGGTNNTYWDEDYWWGIGYKTPIQAAAHPYSASTLGAYDAMFHTHSEAFTDWATTVGETNYMGNTAVQQSSSTRKPYYWEIYSIMGDPSLMTYLKVPTVNTATYPSQIFINATSINVTATPYSRVALTMGGVLYGTALVPAGGSLTLPITAFTAAGTAKLVITAQNKITIMADVSIIPNTGPYVNVTNTVYADTNNNSPEYNETGRFNVTFQNVGSAVATSVVATLTCSTTGITITDNTETIAILNAGASTTVNNAYTFNIANNIANGTSANFTITMVMSGQSNWVHNFSLVIGAPALTFGSITIADPTGNNNGRLDPGETVTITMPLNNTGAAASPAGSATLTCATIGITVNNGNANFSAISAGGSANLTFSITASSGMTIGTVASLVFNATAGAYTANKTETTAVGLILEDFETGNFNAYPWVLGGNQPWTIVNTGAYAGTYCAKSGTIVASQTSTMETTRVLSAPGTLTFYYKVSSESGYDYLKFYVDGVVQGQWAGEVAWTQASYPLAIGTRILKWEYMKDGSVDSGSDCAWVDNIVFPASTAPSIYNPPRNLTALAGNGVVNLSWQAPLSGTPTGYKIFRNSSLLTTVTGLSYSDTAVINETTYSYYLKAVYSGGESDPTATVQATPTAIVLTSVIIGTGTASNGTSEACPINVWYQSLHGQAVYTAAELSAAGVVGPISITQIGFNVTGLPDRVMPNYIVRMGHTTATNVASWIPTGLNTVWTSASYQPTTTGYNMLTLTNPFLWNGTSNIVIDTAFGLIGSYTSTGTTQYTEITNGYIFARNDYSDQTAVFTGGSVITSRPNLKLTLLPNSSPPAIVVNPLVLDFGDLAIGSSDIKTFTIQNTGGATLTGTITTPTGYTVALAAREADLPTGAKSLGERNILGYSVNPGLTKTYNVTFSPTAVTTYNGNIVVTSNDPNHASQNLPVTGAGYIPLTLNLPASFSFDKNGTLQVDFTSYITDSSGNPLILTKSGNTNVIVDINNLLVTFTAVQNWVGTEIITFNLNNGLTQVSDNVSVTVNPVNMPSWTPVTYPNNTATVYGVVTIDWSTCQLNDVVGVFVGDECRSVAEVTVTRETAYVTLLVNLAAQGETVSFKIYDYNTDTIYPVLETYNLNFGQVIGGTTPIPINGTNQIVLAAPVVECTLSAQGYSLQWQAVNQATEYHIYRSFDPYGVYTQIGTSPTPQFTDTQSYVKAFYYVKAVRN